MPRLPQQASRILRDARDDDARKAHISDHYSLWAEFSLE